MGFCRVPLFRKRQFAAEIIVTCVRWYLRFSLSLRDVEELMAERGLSIDHTTVWRWTQRYAPEVQRRLRGQLKPKGSTWHMDETFVRIAGRWMYLFRTVDSGGQTVGLSRRTRGLSRGAFRVVTVAGNRRPVGRTLAVRSAILAALCRRAVTTRMRTLFNFLLGHRIPLAPFSVAKKHTPHHPQKPIPLATVCTGSKKSPGLAPPALLGMRSRPNQRA